MSALLKVLQIKRKEIICQLENVKTLQTFLISLLKRNPSKTFF